MKIIVVLSLGGVLLAGVPLALRELQPLVHDWFEIRDVFVRGAVHVTRKEVLDRLALLPSSTLLTIDTDRLAARLRVHPWIKTVRVERLFAHSLEVTVEERRPAAVLRTPSLSLVLDEEGYVLALSRDETTQELPTLTGVDANALVQGHSQARAAAQAAVRLAMLLQAEANSRGGIHIDISRPDNVMASLDGLQFQFGSSAFEEKWGRYRLVQADIPPSVIKTLAPSRHGETAQRRREIDLRYEGKVIVRERG